MLASGPLGRIGYQLNHLSAPELRFEMKQRGFSITKTVERQGQIRTVQKSKDELETELKSVMKGLTQLNGYGGNDPTSFHSGHFLEHLGVGVDAMHGVKGVCNDLFPILVKNYLKTVPSTDVS